MGLRKLKAEMAGIPALVANWIRGAAFSDAVPQVPSAAAYQNRLEFDAKALGEFYLRTLIGR